MIIWAADTNLYRKMKSYPQKKIISVQEDFFTRRTCSIEFSFPKSAGKTDETEKFGASGREPTCQFFLIVRKYKCLQM